MPVGEVDVTQMYNFNQSSSNELRQSRRASSTATAVAVAAAAASLRQEERVWRCAMCGRVFPDQQQISTHILAEHAFERGFNQIKVFTILKTKKDEKITSHNFINYKKCPY